MPAEVAAAGVTAGGALAGAYMNYRSSGKARQQQAAATEQAAEAEKQRMAEDERRYRERWDEYIRQTRDYEERRRAAMQASSGKTRRYGGKTIDEINAAASSPSTTAAVPTYGVNPTTGLPRTLGDIATKWNDWGQYGLQ